jgi:hypothetical protein
MTTWQDVRAMRASPPGRATSGQRRKTFGSALQQAEELATAAEQAGYSTKPILLFYALSQAYRALCAARLRVDWQPTGHGLAVPNRGSDVLDVVVRKDGDGLYQAAMSVADEAPLAGEVTIGALWASNPELRQKAPADVLSFPGALTLRLAHPLPTDPSAPDDLFMLADGLPEVADAAQLHAALAAYPSLSEAQAANYPTGLRAGFLSEEVDRDGVAHRRSAGVAKLLPVLRVPLANPDEYEARFEEFAPVAVERRPEMRVAPPAIGDPPQVLGPLGTWWLLLLGLASLARYHPALWTAALDVDRSSLAVGLQRVLDQFQESLPHYVLDR